MCYFLRYNPMYENNNAETAKSHATNENALGVVPTNDSTTKQIIIMIRELPFKPFNII